MRRVVVLLADLGLAVGLCVGCRSIPPLPPADFSEAGWRVQQGQAVWKPARGKPELAGELLLATNVYGGFIVQFTKTPFPLATAQASGDCWQLDFESGKYAWRGRGQPPARFVWFQLPHAMTGEGVTRGWRFERIATNSWRFENVHTGETLEGEFFP